MRSAPGEALSGGSENTLCLAGRVRPAFVCLPREFQLRLATGIGITGHPAACSLSRSRKLWLTWEGALLQPPCCTYHALFACSCIVRALRLLHGQDGSTCFRKLGNSLLDVGKDCQPSARAARSVTGDFLQASTSTAFAMSSHVLWHVDVEQPQGYICRRPGCATAKTTSPRLHSKAAATALSGCD